MMESNLATIRKFIDPVLAADFVKMLETEGIQYLVEDASETFDPAFAFNTLNKEIHVRVQAKDFDRVEQLVAATSSDLLKDDIPSDYYLLEFSDEELFEVLAKPDEWNAIDYLLAQRILNDRGQSVNQAFLEKLKSMRTDELAQPTKSPREWIWSGYLFAIAGGLLGIFIGWHLMTFRKTLPDGSRVYVYTDSDRKTGKNILVLGVVATVAYFIWFLMTNVVI